MAHTKSGGSSRNGRESRSKRLGVKLYDGQIVRAGEIIIRQRGTKYQAGDNVRRGGDDTLYSAVSGVIKFAEIYKTGFDGNKRFTKKVSVEPSQK